MSANHGVGRRQGVRQGCRPIIHSFPIDFSQNVSGEDYLLGKFDAEVLKPSVLRVTGVVGTPDNSGTTSVLRIGTAAGGTQLLNDVDLKAAANTSYTPTLPLRVITDTVELWARVTRVGTAATAGRAYVLVEEVEVDTTQPPQP